MVGTVVYVCMYTQNREAAQNTSLGSLFDTFAYSRDIFLRNRTADNGGLELDRFPQPLGIHRLELNFTVTILTTTTGLLRILAVHINGLGEGLFVSNLRSTYISLYLEFTQQTVYDDLQMQLAHTGDDGLAGLLIGMMHGR